MKSVPNDKMGAVKKILVTFEKDIQQETLQWCLKKLNDAPVVYAGDIDACGTMKCISHDVFCKICQTIKKKMEEGK